MDVPALELEKVCFRWPNTPEDFLSIDSVTVKAGEKVLLQGVSGSGKSTLLNLIAGTLKPTSGTIRIAGQPITQVSQMRRDGVRADYMGIIFQQFNLLPYLSILENVILSLRVSKRRAKAVASHTAEAERLIAHLGLAAIDPKRPVSRLSIGQQQRVAAARALIGGPSLLIADEPTSALDDGARDAFMNLLVEEAARTNAAILFVSHDTRLQPYFDQVMQIRDFTPK